MPITLDPVITHAARFLAGRSGTVSIAFAGALLAVILAVGAAIDYGNASRYRAMLESAVDATSLAAAKLAAGGITGEAELTAAVRKIFDVNTASLAANGIGIERFTVTPFPENSRIQVTASASVPTAFMYIANIPALPVGASATVHTGQVLEVALMLDVTGSMGVLTSDKKGTKIAVLEKAAEDLVSTLMPDRLGLGQRVRIALAPYSSGVYLGGLAEAVTGSASGTCAVDRSGSLATTDAPPSDLKFPTGTGCPNRAIMPLTDDRAKLLAALDRLPATGTTAGALGTAFAYNLLSPRWAGVFPVGSVPEPTGTPDLKKIAILMTDGEYNFMEGRYASSSVVNARAEDLCDAMRAGGITIYTVGFELRSGAARQVLRDCASMVNGKKAFYDAKDGKALLDAYQAIADEILRLHLAA